MAAKGPARVVSHQGASQSTSSYNFKNNKSDKRTSSKLKQLLPEETYQVHIEFAADAPTRVVVRLERLLGTDKVRLTDTKYMIGLIEKINQEEEKTLLKRTKLRKKVEEERHRQLAVEGLLAPQEGMESLENHPVYRMNKVLNRLTKMGEELSREGGRKFPPITPTEPFTSGGSPRFESFGRKASNGACNDGMDQAAEIDWSNVEGEGEEDEILDTPKKIFSRKRFADDDEETFEEDRDVTFDMEEMEDAEWGGEDYRTVDKTGSLLTATKMQYKIPDNVNLEKCRPYRSKLVNLVYDSKAEETGPREMFDVAAEVLGAYQRESLASDDFVIKLIRMSNTGR